jgi:AcrR family transcriptional regulator
MGSGRTDTHALLQSTALALFKERGYDGVTAMEIACAAGVTERTFFRHFASKDEILLAGHEERLALLDRVLGSRPPDEPVLDSLRVAVGDVAVDFMEAPQDFWLRMRLVSDTPSLAWRNAKMQADWERAFASFLRPRLGSPDGHLRARLMAACAVAALRAALEDWLERGGSTDVDLRELCDRALLMAAGPDLGWSEPAVVTPT